jgi:hypothetical protein
MRLFRAILLTPLVLWAVIGPFSAYRAYFQVQAIDLSAPAELRPGTQVRGDILTSGRVEAILVLELVQGTHSEVLANVRVPRNQWAYWNLRSAVGTATATVSADRLARFASGSALLRATGHGSPQWLRTPPPEQREVVVQIRMQ